MQDFHGMIKTGHALSLQSGVYIFGIKTVFFPQLRIVDYVMRNFIEGKSISNDDVPKQPLPTKC
jgi:hypothetical protein